MDAAWKVYVGDRRFDDNQISNLFLKLKYETVGRFTFDFRPIDGDESYMQNGRTLRIFWGDIHKLDGVIQRVDWDDTLYCYHVFGADIRGFLLDRVNTEPSTVSSYTSDVQTQVMYTGCDFPSNIWTGAGDKIGTYTFHYKLGIQNTIRITGATQNIWHNVIERGTVYEHVDGCLYDATKNWVANQYAGATLRFVSGACKNNVYNINGNTSNRVCIRLPGEPATMYSSQRSEPATMKMVQGSTCRLNIIQPGFEGGAWTAWTPYSKSYTTDDCVSGTKAWAKANPNAETDSGLGNVGYFYKTGVCPGYWEVSFWYKMWGITNATAKIFMRGASVNDWYIDMPIVSDWTQIVATVYVDSWGPLEDGEAILFYWDMSPSNRIWFDDVALYVPTTDSFSDSEFVVSGKIPGCSRLGDIYEIVTASMERIEPASLTPATLEKDNHIIQYNQTDELPDHPTVITVMGAD